MLMPEGFVDILRCPIAKVPLRRMARGEIVALNELITQGAALQARGDAVASPVEDALLADDGSWAYRVDSGVPTLLP